MDYFTFISKLTEHLAWPILIIVIVLILKKPISTLIEKLKKANIKGSEFEFGTQPAQTPSKLEATPVNIPIPTDTVGMQQEFESLIRRDLDAANISEADTKENILISHLAATQLNAIYERVNSSIFGSQIDLLRLLNSVSTQTDMSSLKLFYDDAVTKYPEFYNKSSFVDYVNYLSSMGLVDQHDDGYRITKLGIGYLVYIAEKGLTGFRHY